MLQISKNAAHYGQAVGDADQAHGLQFLDECAVTNMMGAGSTWRVGVLAYPCVVICKETKLMMSRCVDV